MSEWKKSTQELPNESGSYFVFYDNTVRILVWNENHECWDDDSGDDYFCDPTDVTHWMELIWPSAPLDNLTKAHSAGE